MKQHCRGSAIGSTSQLKGKSFLKEKTIFLSTAPRDPSGRMVVPVWPPPSSCPSRNDCSWGSLSDRDLKEPDPEMSHQEMPFLGMITTLLFGVWSIVELF